MEIVDVSAETPEMALALDEFMLLKAEAGEAGETLRLWSSPEYFVVLGRARRLDADCEVDLCGRDNIRILRRLSGGGTVLQGPGCLNFSLVLSYSRDGQFRDIRLSYRKILGNICSGLRALGINAEVLPLSDMALGNKKFSGNAQARKRRFFLHHGTVLHGFDIEKIGMYLKHPDVEPEYRLKRPHSDFVTNIPLSSGEVSGVIKEAFGRPRSIFDFSTEDMNKLKELIKIKYQNREWNAEGSLP